MRIRFSLRTFLLMVTILGASLGCAAAWRQGIVDRTERHLRAVEELNLRTLSPVILGKETNPTYVNLVRAWIHPRAFEVRERICASTDFWTPNHLAALKELNGLREVNCSFECFTLDNAKVLVAIPELKKLTIRYKQADTQAVATIAAREQLESLSVFGEVDESFYDAVRGHKTLVYLGVDKTIVSRARAADFATIPNLKELDATANIADSTIFPALATSKAEKLGLSLSRCDVAHLSSLKQSQVRELALYCDRFEPGTLKAVSKIPHLKVLSLNGPVELEPDEFKALAGCTELESLRLRDNLLSPRDFDTLIDLPNLKTVIAHSAPETDLAIQRFKNAKPGRTFKSP